MDARDSKITTLVRVVLGVGLVYAGWDHFGDPPHVARTLGVPLDLALWLALAEFSVGLCLVVGVLSRLSGLIVLLGALWLTIAAGPGVWTPFALVAGLYLTLRGGGAYSMDRYIGHMQRRVSERELAREAARLAEQSEPRP